jgi:hypothetical protein
MKDRKKNKADPLRSISVSVSVSMPNDGVVMVAGAETPASVGVQTWTPVSKQGLVWGTNKGERCTNNASRSFRIQKPIFSALEALSTPIYLHWFPRRASRTLCAALPANFAGNPLGSAGGTGGDINWDTQ